MFRPRDCEGKLAVKVFCLFYGKKYPYSNVLKLEKEFKRYGVDFYCHTDLKDEQYHLSGIKEHWHKIRFFDSNFTGRDDIIVIDIDQKVVGDIKDMIEYPVKENELVTYKNWWNEQPRCPINGGWYKFKGGSLDYVWDKFSKNIQKWQLYYFETGVVHYKYYGEQNFVHDTVLENGGKITTMPEEWYSKYPMDEYRSGVKIIHYAGVHK